MQLAAAQEFPLDLTLQAAGVTEAVTVKGNATAMDLSSARIGVNVTEREVENLPVNGRQMSQLMLQAPGSQNAGTGTWNDVRFSGRANQQNVIKFDGVEGSAIIDAAPGNIAGQIASPFKLQASLENVQEFRVESNNYPAEFGTGTGGQVSVITKSGSNQVSGSLFEYYRDDSLDAPNYFDSTRNTDGSVIQELPKSALSQHQFGGSIGAPVMKNRAFLFASYEGYRLDAGVNFVEAAPSAAAWSRAVPAIAPLRPGFTSPEAVLLPDASANPDFDIYQLQSLENVEENSVSARFDFRMNDQWSSYVRVFHDRGTQLRPEGVSGRVVRVTNEPTNAIFNVQGTLSAGLLTEFKVGYNAPKADIHGLAPVVNGIDFGVQAFNLSGSIANTGIAGQSASSGIVVPGGLVRANSATNGRAAIYDPSSIAFANTTTLVRGNHLTKVGADVRLIGMTFDQQGGTTYSFANIDAFLRNQPSGIQYAGDISSPSVFNNGATGMRETRQNYFVAFAQDEWKLSPHFTLNYGLRYDYYTPLTVKDDLFVKFNLDTGTLDPNTVDLHGTKKNSFQPRLAATYNAGKTVVPWRLRRVRRAGPGRGPDPADRERPRQHDAQHRSAARLPDQHRRAGRQLHQQPEQPQLPAARLRRRIQHPGEGLPVHGVGAARAGRRPGRDRGLRRQPGPQPVPAQRRQPDRRRGHPPEPRQRGLHHPRVLAGRARRGGAGDARAEPVCRGRLQDQRRPRRVQRDDAVAEQALGERPGDERPVHARQEPWHVGRIERGEYGRQQRPHARRVRVRGRLQQLRRPPHVQPERALLGAVRSRPQVRQRTSAALTQALLGGWDVGGIVNARSGLPVPVQIVRPDIVYRDATGNIFANPAAGRTAIINVPGGGASRNVRRPDLIPGVDPFIKDGGLLFLNPAAFATPAPGTFGNLERNAIHGPDSKQVDMFFAKHFSTGGRSNIEFRCEIFNLFDTVNFANPVGTLPQAIPTAALTEANRVQPGQPYTAAAAGTFGRLSSTVGRTVGLGTPRQIQFAVRFQF